MEILHPFFYFEPFIIIFM